MHLYVYDCVIHWDVHVGYSGSRCCAHNFGTAGCWNNGLSEHSHTRANNGLQPKRIALLPVASNCFSTSSLLISKSVRIFMRASPVSLLSVIVFRRYVLRRLIVLNDRSADAVETGTVNKIFRTQ